MKSAVRIGVVDSGVHAAHPHVGGIVGGVGVEDIGYSSEYIDRLGHGTAIASLIHRLAPTAELICVRVFNHALATSLDRVIRAIDWCLEHNIDIINLSLGTVNPHHREAFVAAIARVQAAGAALVSAFEMNGNLMLPGSLPGTIGVSADPECPVGAFQVIEREGKSVFYAPPFPREIPGVPRERNLHGVSFAVAHISARLSSCWPHSGGSIDPERLLTSLVPNAVQ